MFSIEDNEVTVVKGDTGAITVKLDNYSLSNGDEVKFSVKKNLTDIGYIISKTVTSFTGGLAIILLSANDTNIEKGKYWYDIQVTTNDGRVDTIVLPSRFEVLQGVTN